MKVNILPSILKGGGGRDKGGTEKEGGRTGRGDIQGGGTYMEGGHTGSGGWVVSVRGGSLSVGIHYSWAGSSCVRRHLLFVGGVMVVRGGSSLSAVGGHRHPWAQRCLSCRQGVVGVVWGVFGTRRSWWGCRCPQRVIVGAWGVIVVHGIRGWSSSVGGRLPLCMRGVIVCPCVCGGSSSFVGAGSLFGGGHRGWREVIVVVCVCSGQRGTPGWTVDVPRQQFGGGTICWAPPPSAFFGVVLPVVVRIVVVVVGVSILWWW
jgi:hypothetical protein